MKRLSLLFATFCLLATPAVLADTYCSVQYRLTDGTYEKQTVYAKDVGTERGVVPLDALGPGCRMEAREDRCILHLANAAFIGQIASGGRLDLRLTGRNGLTMPEEGLRDGGHTAINGEDLSISGPGSLTILHFGEGSVVSASSLEIKGGATVDVTAADGTNGNRSDASCIGSYTSVHVRNATLLVRNFCTGTIYGSSGAGINCVDFEASSATVSALTTGMGIRVATWSTPKAKTGSFRVRSSSIHALSMGDSSGILYESGRSEGAAFEVSDSVLCAHGKIGVNLAGAHGKAVASLVRVSGIITGKQAGFRCDVPLSLSGSKLLIAGNLHGEKEPEWYGDVGAAAVFKEQISGPFVQESGETTLLAPRAIALQAPEFVLKGGTVKIAPRVGRDDVLKVWSADFATRELRSLVGVSLGADATTLLTDEHGIVDVVARTVLTDTAYLFHRNLSDPLVGVRSQSVSIEGGALKVENAAEAGIQLCWPREGDGTLTMSDGTLDVRGEGIALQGYKPQRGMLGSSAPSDWKDRGLFLSGGTATFSGGANAILLRSFLRQTGGSLTVRVDGAPSEIEETDAYPFHRGCALFAAGGFAKTGGSFRAESGVVKTVPEAGEP